MTIITCCIQTFFAKFTASLIPILNCGEKGGYDKWHVFSKSAKVNATTLLEIKLKLSVVRGIVLQDRAAITLFSPD